MINKELADERNLPEGTRLKINRLHKRREDIFKRMNGTDIVADLRVYDKSLDLLEEDLQKLWGFPLDSNYVKFWNRPQCSCPQLDNEENYPHGYYTRSGNCPLHGGIND